MLSCSPRSPSSTLDFLDQRPELFGNNLRLVPLDVVSRTIHLPAGGSRQENKPLRLQVANHGLESAGLTKLKARSHEDPRRNGLGFDNTQLRQAFGLIVELCAHCARKHRASQAAYECG